MPPVTVFLSCATTEFGPQRVRLDQQLRAIGAGVHSQETFRQNGKVLLDQIDEKIRASDYVIHLIGDTPGAIPPPEVVTSLLADDRFRELAPRVGWAKTVDPFSLTYTQWEYWLGLYHKKTCIVFVMVAGKDPADSLQRAHLDSIRKNGHLRDRPENEWHLVALAMKSLLNLSGKPDSTRIAPASPDPPAIVLSLSTTPSAHLLTGGVRLGGSQFVRLADPVEVNVSRPDALAGAFTDLIRRCELALAGRQTDGVGLLPIVELLLPAHLLFRPVSDWVFYPRADRTGKPEPIRQWFPLRLRVADRGQDGQDVKTLARRLERLRRHKPNRPPVGREIPLAHRGQPDPPPIAVVHDCNADAWWQHDGSVCGAFTSPPERPARVRVSSRARPASPLRRAADHGVPYLVWPEKVTVTADLLEAHLKAVDLDRLCHFFQTMEFAVLAESDGPGFDGPAMVSGVPSSEGFR